jgi:hypothetical protein
LRPAGPPTSLPRVVALTDQDKEAVVDLVREVHGEDTARQYELLWDWSTKDNPAFAATDSYRIGYRVDGRVRGALSIIPGRMKVGKQVFPCLCPLDLVISPTVRRHGFPRAAVAIGRALEGRHAPVVFGNTDARNVPLWARIFNREPVILIGRYRCYYRELTLAPQLARRRITGGLAKLLGAAHRVLDASSRLLLALRCPRDIKIERQHGFGTGFDDLWRRASDSHPNCLVRDSAFLSWRFGRMPGRNHVVLGATRGGTLVGYAVLRPIEENGSLTIRVVDIFTHQGEAGVFRSLIRAVIAEARARGATRVAMLELFQPVLRRELALALFFVGRWTVSISGRCLGCPQDEFYDTRRWWITYADSDLDFERVAVTGADDA